MFKHRLVALATGFIVAIASQAFGQVPGGTKIGTLNCQLAPSVGFIIGSHDPMRCRYTPDGPFPPEFYEGVINTIGLDIGFKTGGEMAWAVVAPTVGPPGAGLLAITSARAEASQLGEASGRTYWSAAQGARLLCSPYRCKDRQAWISRWA